MTYQHAHSVRGHFHRLACRALLAATLSTLSACGGGKDDSSGPAPVVTITTSNLKPAAYTMTDPACLESTDPVDLHSGYIHTWSDGKIHNRRQKLNNTRSQKSLISDAVSETTWGDLFERTCDVNLGAGHYCDDEKGEEKLWKNNPSQGGFLRICRNDFTWPRNSYEGVGLTSAVHIATARARYQDLMGDSAKNLPRLHLMVLPEFVDYYDNFPHEGETKRLKAWITHNVGYFSGADMIAVFPESEKKADTLPGFFWESAFVLAHEFGHHIDHTMTGFMTARSGLRWNPVTHRYVDEEFVFRGATGGYSKKAQVRGAVGEAFADLVAYYAEGGTARSLSGMPDIGYNRNISLQAFSNGDEKVLNDERAELFFGLREEDEDNTTGPYYSDIHYVGAIIAHTADKVFSTLSEARPDLAKSRDDKARLHYQLTNLWLEKIVTHAAGLTNSHSMEDALVPVAQGFEDVATAFLTASPLTATGDNTDPDDTVRAAVCRIVAEHFPVASTPAFALTNGDCPAE